MKKYVKHYIVVMAVLCVFTPCTGCIDKKIIWNCIAVKSKLFSELCYSRAARLQLLT